MQDVGHVPVITPKAGVNKNMTRSLPMSYTSHWATEPRQQLCHTVNNQTQS